MDLRWRLGIAAASCLYAAAALALTPAELVALKSEVLQMCRGGTLSGTKISSVAISGGQVVTLDGVLGRNVVDRVFVSSEQWSGIEALLIKSPDYTSCVNSTVATLAPLIEEKQNVDTNLNARLSYINSASFCDRLVYVVSRAPTGFAEWRTTSASDSRWPIGKYLMKDVDAVGMISNQGSSLDSAAVETRKDGSFGFYEPLVYTHRFDAQHDIGLIVNKISKSFTECLTPRRFYSVKGVSFRDGPRVRENGMVIWSFNKTGRFGATSDTFDVYVMPLDLKKLSAPTTLIYVNIESP